MKKRRIGGSIFKGIISVFLTLILIGIISGSIMAAFLAVYIKENIDTEYDIENLKMDLNQTTSIYYMEYTDDHHTEGKWVELEEERLHGSENRLWVSFDEMPDELIDCVVAIEDKRFWDHHGVDWRRTVGAVLHVFKSGSVGYGGSTITQQLIKNVTGEDDVKIQRKIQEIFRALSLEEKKSKEEILEMYLNTIYLSQGCGGVQAAANYYFHKDVSELTLVECACLVGITNRPTYYDPIQNPENNKYRRQVIFEELLDQKIIDKDTFDEVYDQDIVLFNGDITEEDDSNVRIHSWFVDTVMDDVISDLMEQKGMDEASATQLVYSGGLQIYTTMDLEVQSAMEEVFESDEYFPDVDGVQPESAMVVVNPYNGNVLGIVGGRGEKKENRGWNRATMTTRQPGSSIKPLSAYSQGIEEGIITYSTAIDDFPFNINPTTGNAWPSNSPAQYRGYTTVADAVIRSVNTVAVRIVDKLGTENVFNFLRNKYRLSTLYENVGGTHSDMSLSPLALGGFTYGVTLRDMASAYATFANDGIFNKSRTYVKVCDAQGHVILSNEEKSEVVLSHDTALVMTKILSEVADPAGYGTARRLTVTKDVDVAAKTGTTNDNKDLYFAAYTPYFSGAAWFGYDQPRYMQNFSPSPALTVWDEVMKRVHQKYIDRGGVEEFDFSELVERVYCKDSGLLAGEYCSLDPRGNRTATGYYTRNTVPTSECNAHVEVQWCTETKSVADVGCPEDKVITIALVRNENRRIEKNVAVTDAQYTYMQVPHDYVYPDDTSLPFFMNLYLNGTYPGFTSGVNRPVNSYCVEHNKENTTSWQKLCEEYRLAHPEEFEDEDEDEDKEENE